MSKRPWCGDKNGRSGRATAPRASIESLDGRVRDIAAGATSDAGGVQEEVRRMAAAYHLATGG
jgi:hypothetical protein